MRAVLGGPGGLPEASGGLPEGAWGGPWEGPPREGGKGGVLGGLRRALGGGVGPAPTNVYYVLPYLKNTQVHFHLNPLNFLCAKRVPEGPEGGTPKRGLRRVVFGVTLGSLFDPQNGTKMAPRELLQNGLRGEASRASGGAKMTPPKGGHQGAAGHGVQ